MGFFSVRVTSAGVNITIYKGFTKDWPTLNISHIKKYKGHNPLGKLTGRIVAINEVQNGGGLIHSLAPDIYYPSIK
jgi:hypothetical protein